LIRSVGKSSGGVKGEAALSRLRNNAECKSVAVGITAVEPAAESSIRVCRKTGGMCCGWLVILGDGNRDCSVTGIDGAIVNPEGKGIRACLVSARGIGEGSGGGVGD